MERLIFGLGNPGKKYAQTRHNIGWLALVAVEARGSFKPDRVRGPMEVREGQIHTHEVITIRPQTFMNASGDAGKAALRRWKAKPKDAIVLHDDLDLPFGRIRVRVGGSSGGQRGIASLIESFGTPEFTRVRVGIGRPPEGMDPVEYVLDRFTDPQWTELAAVLERVADAVVALLDEPLEQVMSRFNRAVP